MSYNSSFNICSSGKFMKPTTCLEKANTSHSYKTAWTCPSVLPRGKLFVSRNQNIYSFSMQVSIEGWLPVAWDFWCFSLHLNPAAATDIKSIFLISWPILLEHLTVWHASIHSWSKWFCDLLCRVFSNMLLPWKKQHFPSPHGGKVHDSGRRTSWSQ